MSIVSLCTAAVTKIRANMFGQQAYVCFYCGAIYHDQDEYNTHVEVTHYHER